ncbi:MAG: hypothetical protein M5U01_00250 [Ardenticatenaceae bacterium]|nr:hypothetical protein [Ardenticatenaceae bacterium]
MTTSPESPREDDLFFGAVVESSLTNPRFLRCDCLAADVERRRSDPDCCFLLLTTEPAAGIWRRRIADSYGKSCRDDRQHCNPDSAGQIVRLPESGGGHTCLAAKFSGGRAFEPPCFPADASLSAGTGC